MALEVRLLYLPDGYEWNVDGTDLSIQFRDLHSNSQGLHSEIEIFQTIEGDRVNHYWADLNLKAARSKGSLAALMEKRVPAYPLWEPLIDMLCYKTAQEFRKPSEVVIIGHSDPPKREYRLWPFLAEDEPSVVFGEGGNGKTWLAVAMCFSIASGVGVANMLPIQGPVLYIDYETNRYTMERRFRQLARGLDIPCPEILYYRGTAAVARDVASILAHIRNNNVKYVVIDSASLAVGGMLENVEAVGAYFSALRQLGVGSLTITHTAKGKEYGGRSAFGSVYWTNLPRSVWEVLGNQEEGAPILYLGVKHNKVNEEGKQPRFGFTLSFMEDAVYLESTAVDELSGLKAMHSTMQKIVDAFEDMDVATIKELAKAAEIKEATVQKAIYRNPGKFELVAGGKGVQSQYRYAGGVV